MNKEALKATLVGIIVLSGVVIGYELGTMKYEPSEVQSTFVKRHYDPPVVASSGEAHFLGDYNEQGDRKSDYALDDKHVYLALPADPKTFEVLKGNLKSGLGDYINYKYARDEHRVFYEGRLIYEANPTNFKPIENGDYSHSYGTDGNYVFYETHHIVNADPKTFQILWHTIYEGCGLAPYSKDSKRVYSQATQVEGADPESFEALINGYGKDKRGYYQGIKYIGPTLDKKELVCDFG